MKVVGSVDNDVNVDTPATGALTATPVPEAAPNFTEMFAATVPKPTPVIVTVSPPVITP